MLSELCFYLIAQEELCFDLIAQEDEVSKSFRYSNLNGTGYPLILQLDVDFSGFATYNFRRYLQPASSHLLEGGLEISVPFSIPTGTHARGSELEEFPQRCFLHIRDAWLVSLGRQNVRQDARDHAVNAFGKLHVV